MDHPDLSTKTGRKAWRHDMRMVAVRPRRYGLWLLTIGFLLVMAPSAFGLHSILGWSPTLLGLIAMAAALPLLIAGMLLQRRYRRQQMDRD